MSTPKLSRPDLQWYDLKTGQRSRKGVTGAAYADIEDGGGRYERRGEGRYFTAVFIDSDGTETVLPKEGSQDPAQDVSLNAAYRAHVSHYHYGREREALRRPADALRNSPTSDQVAQGPDAAALLAALPNIRVDTHDDGRRVPYKYILLLWAISKARAGSQRFKFQDVSSELSALLRPFQVSSSRPDPRNPWFALKETPLWWDLNLRDTTGVTYKQTRELNLEGGLSRDALGFVIGDPDFVARAVSVMVDIIGDSHELRDLIVKLQLDGATSLNEQPPIIRKIPVENHMAEDFAAEYKALGRRDRTRKEAQLQGLYEDYLRNTMRHEICRHEIRIDDQVLYTDIYDETSRELIEVKSSIERNTMRLALGQILDYAQAIMPEHRSVLVPERPARDVIELFHQYDVSVVWRSGDSFSSLRSADSPHRVRTRD